MGGSSQKQLATTGISQGHPGWRLATDLEGPGCTVAMAGLHCLSITVLLGDIVWLQAVDKLLVLDVVRHQEKSSDPCLLTVD